MAEAYIDTGLFIALVFDDDDNHTRAQEVFFKELIKRSKYRRLFTSDAVLIETASFIHSPGRRLRKQDAFRKVEQILNVIKVYRVEVLSLDESSLNDAVNLYKKYEGNKDFVDVINISLMRQKGIVRIASFDSKDYDDEKDITRVS
ncbi:MAG: type II toxin-antitoxin system VapC family toxin [Dehalococcoidia bacterium]|nr:type II toxin-antitoxin system VapC family toxin [Dehalococcoidia bacterium]